MKASRLQYRYSLTALFALITVICIISWVGTTVTRRVDLTDVSAERANEAFHETLSGIRVPLRATHVDVHARFRGGEASFDIEPSEFLTWAKASWQLKAIDVSEDPDLINQLDAYEWPTTVTNAYYFQEKSARGSGWTVLYDRNDQRAWVAYSPR